MIAFAIRPEDADADADADEDEDEELTFEVDFPGYDDDYPEDAE